MNIFTPPASPSAAQPPSIKMLIACGLGVFILLIPLLIQQFQTALNTNHAWLLIVAERFLNGGQYGSEFFEPNPPMSVLLYVPQYLMHSWGGLPLIYTPAAFTCLFILLCGGITIALLKSSRIIHDPFLKIILAFSYLFACIFMPGNLYFGDRDHFVFIALFPLLLAQIHINKGQNYPYLACMALFTLGGLILLIKPHYGLFPALLFMHRVYIRKSIMPVLRAPDFAGLSLSVILYIALILIFFKNFITIMLPALLTIYIGSLSGHILPQYLHYISFLIPLACATWLAPLAKQKRNVIAILCAAAVLGFFLYYVQSKAFPYHLIPGQSFSYIAYSVLFWSLLDRFFASRRGAVLAASLFALFSFAVLVQPPYTNFPTHQEYANLPLGQEMKKCGAPCPNYVFSQNMETVFQSNLYSGEITATRYPGLWWLYALYGQEDGAARMAPLIQGIIDDFKLYRPKMLMIATNIDIVSGQKDFDLIALLRTNPEFEGIFENYRFDHVLHDNRRYYFKGTSLDVDYPIDYNVYYLK